ncbi:hypothetical protein [Natrarchaeobaculum sulfurireducens]|uniref:Major capsid protein n=1 Tax=Natrarchaeobaculum sulfurireducens TaxID=2044521 RepID=A0A346PPQ7_9EURY|nr:hypothetical protein [Natrarchaeobaculum sulfurireducens]AXR81502.1 hypothetical protein AArcMg_1489 [Natrarchaeobaculum sulfurireducens]
MASIASELNVTDSEQAFKNAWTRDPYGVPAVRKDGDKDLTPTLQNLEKQIYADEDELEAMGLDDQRPFKGMVARSLQAARSADTPTAAATKEVVSEMEARGVVDAEVAENSTPLVFDPEVLDIQKTEAPLAAGRLPTEGQEGYRAVYNVIDDRDDPIGYVSEGESANVLDDARGMSMERGEVDMAIYVDTAAITDFSAQAAAHYVDLEDLTLGARVAEHAQLKEQTVLYGDTSVDAEDGGPGDANAYDGLATIFDEADNAEDKSGFDPSAEDDDKALVNDVKAEINEILQSEKNVSRGDLEVWTSYTVVDRMESELTNIARHDTDQDTVAYGHDGITINGVPVVPSHNVDEHDIGAEDPVGDEGDVFIVNTRSVRFRQLAPLSSIPLGTRGLADEVAMFEYGALIARAEGQWGRYLQAYDV